jgi:hypothetical protein
MKTRRLAYWWFRFVLSGRFLETFLNLRPVRRSREFGARALGDDAASELLPDGVRAGCQGETSQGQQITFLQ